MLTFDARELIGMQLVPQLAARIAFRISQLAAQLSDRIAARRL